MKPVKNSWPYPYYVGQRYKSKTTSSPHIEIEITAITPDGQNVTYQYLIGLQSELSNREYSCSIETFLACTNSIK